MWTPEDLGRQCQQDKECWQSSVDAGLEKTGENHFKMAFFSYVLL